MSDDTERWLPVVGYEGYYEVSDRGRVRSVERFVSRGGAPMHVRARILRCHQRPDLRTSVVMARDGINRNVFVHTLVLTAFMGPRPSGQEACHWNGDASDNRLENLRWDTRSGNRRDMIRHGRDPKKSKTHCVRGHLLAEPNLKAAALKRGLRECLACGRTHSAARYARERGELIDFRAEADARYLDIMGSAAAA